MFPRKIRSIETNVRHWKTFPLININLYNQWNVGAMETFGEFLEAAT